MTKQHHTPDHFMERRFTLITGKGGVGKTTVTALLAKRSAQRGHRTLVCELNSQEQFSQLMGLDPVGPVIKRVDENLWAVNIDPEEALIEYGLMKLRYRALYQMVFNHPLVRTLVKFVPGMNDLLMLGKAFHHERERNEDGGPLWDRIIIDAPATGHGVTFFRLPKVIRDAVPRGNMHRETSEMWSLLSDPERTAVHLVTLPEGLPIQETKELRTHLVHEMNLPLGCLFINRMPEAPLSEGLMSHLLNDVSDDAVLGPIAHGVRMRKKRTDNAESYRGSLNHLAMPTMVLPEVYSATFGPSELDILSSTLSTAEAGDE